MKRIGLLILILSMCLSCSFAEEYTARIAEDWLLNLADYLSGLQTINDPGETEDLSRPGEYLLQYDFGTVITRGGTVPQRGSIVEVTMETGKIADCLGHTVGTKLSELEIPGVLNPMYPLTLIAMQQEGIGWLWVYGRDGEPYGIEWVSYDLESAESVETVLTYTIESGTVTAIRVRKNEMTVDEAMANLASVGELDATQRASARAKQNDLEAFSSGDAVLNGVQLVGLSSDRLAQFIGDPVTVQNLPAGQGRLLLYDGLVATCNLEEQSGVETVLALAAVTNVYTGPRNIRTGMSLRDAIGLFRVDRTVTTAGGTLYQEDTLSGLPQGQLIRYEEDEETLVYGCESDLGELWLEMTFQDEQMTAWRLYVTQQSNTQVNQTLSVEQENIPVNATPAQGAPVQTEIVPDTAADEPEELG